MRKLISHFKYKNARYKNYVEAVNYIEESMIGNECINATAPEISLEAYADRGNFKLYMGDTGLLVTQIMRNSDETENSLYKALIFDRLGINQGMLLENINPLTFSLESILSKWKTVILFMEKI